MNTILLTLNSRAKIRDMAGDGISFAVPLSAVIFSPQKRQSSAVSRAGVNDISSNEIATSKQMTIKMRTSYDARASAEISIAGIETDTGRSVQIK